MVRIVKVVQPIKPINAISGIIVIGSVSCDDTLLPNLWTDGRGQTDDGAAVLPSSVCFQGATPIWAVFCVKVLFLPAAQPVTGL